MDYGKYTKRGNAPTFYGVMEDSANHEDNDVAKVKGDELIVMFVVSGEYEWYGKNVPNTLISNYKKDVLVLSHLPPVLDLFSGDDATRWFSRGRSGWEVKVFEDPCYGCGSPWCLYHGHRSDLKEMLFI